MPGRGELAQRFNVHTYWADYHDLLGEVDGAIIAVPTHLHCRITLDFLSSGTHVLCEKPLAETAAEARQMVEHAESIGVTLSTNYNRRLFPSIAAVKDLLAGGTLGEPLSIRYVIGEEFDWPTVSGFYFVSNIASRGILRDRGSHVLDTICWWLGAKPRLIESQNDSFGGSDAVAYVRFAHQRCVGEVKLSWLSKFPCQYTITCEGGTIEGEEYDFTSITLQKGSGPRQHIKLHSHTRTFGETAHQITSNFVDVARGGASPIVPGRAVLDSIEWIDECYQAATRFDMPWYSMLEVAHGLQ